MKNIEPNYYDHPKNSCIISNQKKLIFINIPKCATKSIKNELKSYKSKNSILTDLTDEEMTYYKFTFIRNPIQRFLSGYLTIIFKYQYLPQNVKDLSFWKFTDKKKRFNDFCNCVKQHGFFDCHIAPFSYFLENVKLDYIGCLENYNNDIQYILKQFGIKYKGYLDHQTQHKLGWNSNNKIFKESYKNYNITIDDLTPKQLNLIKTLYNDDIQLYETIRKKNIISMN